MFDQMKQSLIRAMQDPHYAQSVGIPAYSAMTQLQEITAYEQAAQQQQAMQAAQMPSMADQVIAQAEQGGLGALPQGQPQTASPGPISAEPVMAARGGGVADLMVDNVGNEGAYRQGGIVAFAVGGGMPNKYTDPNYERVIYGYQQALPMILDKYKRGAKLSPEELNVVAVLQQSNNVPSTLGSVLTAEPRISGGLEKLALGDQATEATPIKTPSTGGTPSVLTQSPAVAIDSPLLSDLQAKRGYGAPDVPAATPKGPRVPGGPGSQRGSASSDKSGIVSVLPTGQNPFSWTDLQDPDYRGVIEAPIPAMGYAKQMRDMIGVDPSRAAQTDRLAKMEAAAEKEGAIAPWMSLAQAGFAIAGGDSPYALQNIGKGAMVGVEQLNKYKDKALAAEEKRFEMSQKLADAQRQEDLMVAKYGAESEQAQKARIQAQKLAEKSDKARRDEANAAGRYRAQADKAGYDLDVMKEKNAQARHSESLAVQRAGINKLSDYETYLKGAQEDPDNYKTVTVDGKKVRQFDIAKVTEAYRGYGKSDSAGLDADTVYKAWEKSREMDPDNTPDWPEYYRRAKQINRPQRPAGAVVEREPGR